MRIEREGAVALLRMENGKANAMSPTLLERLDGLLEQLGDARAAVITGQGNAFSAGLDLPTLAGMERAAMRAFIRRFEVVMMKAFELPIPLIAAVNGHAVAGGCVLALQADIRIAADRDSKIGLNETQLGIGLPAAVIETLRWQVPGSSLAPIALEGRLWSPREALQLGLLHEVVPEGELLRHAVQRAAALAALPAAGLRMVKESLRKDIAATARARQDEQAESWLDGWFSEDTQGKLKETVARLRK
jgi:enoyl-CoA hydratase/carnithine racemase